MSSSRSAVSTSEPGPEGDDPARKEHDLVVLHRLGDVVGGRDDGGAPGHLRGERLQVELAPARVEARRRLVQDDEIRPAGEGLGEVDALLLAAREAAQGRAGEAATPIEVIAAATRSWSSDRIRPKSPRSG